MKKGGKKGKRMNENIIEGQRDNVRKGEIRGRQKQKKE
jgi:hypothetical protein